MTSVEPQDVELLDAADGRPAPRERILDAADRLFALGGVRATGVNAIIASADVAKATFYRHFPSKDYLVTTWLTARAPRWLDDVLAATERRAPDPAQRLDAFIDAFVDRVAHAGAGGFPFLETALELRTPSPEVGRAIAAYLGEVKASLTDLAAAAGSEAPAEAAVQLQLVLFGVLTLYRALPSETSALGRWARSAGAAIVRS